MTKQRDKSGAFWITLILLLIAPTPCPADQVLMLQIDGFASNSGVARILLFDSPSSYDGTAPPFRIVSVPIAGGRAVWSADDIPQGVYAAIVHHDEDGNDALNRPYFSLPLERYGYSKGAWKTFGLPAFDEVAFEIGSSPVTQRITIRYNPIAFGLVAMRPYRNIIGLTFILVLPMLVGGGLRRWLPNWASNSRLFARYGLSCFLLATSSVHFLSTAQMTLMLPEWVPVRFTLIYVTGVLELLLALALLIPGWARQVGIIVAAMLILFLPANIYAAMHHVPYGGNEIGPVYLLARVPYQVFLVTWTLWATGLLWRTDATYRTDADAA